MAVCRGCGAEIIWVRTPKGGRTPIDAEPVWVKLVPHGHTFIRRDGSFIFGERAGDADDSTVSNFKEAHESHYATCPVGGKFRKPRKPRERDDRTPFF